MILSFSQDEMSRSRSQFPALIGQFKFTATRLLEPHSWSGSTCFSQDFFISRPVDLKLERAHAKGNLVALCPW